MKKLFRFALLVGVLGMAWTMGGQPSWAAPICEFTDGTPCTSPPRTQVCDFADGSGSGSCFCSRGTWICTL
jgi:hypothetical protein